MRSKLVEEIETKRNRVLAMYECGYCGKENIFDVVKGSNTGDILHATRTCDSCGMPLTADDFEGVVMAKILALFYIRNHSCHHTVQIGDTLCSCELSHGHEGSHQFKVRRK